MLGAKILVGCSALLLPLVAGADLARAIAGRRVPPRSDRASTPVTPVATH